MRKLVKQPAHFEYPSLAFASRGLRPVNECESGSPHECMSSAPKQKEIVVITLASSRLPLLLAVEFVEHVVVTLDTLLASVVEMIRVAEHLVDFHAAAPVL